MTIEQPDLPVIDVTDPRFALADDRESVAALFAAYEREERRWRFVPGFITRLMLKLAARRSLLVRALVDPSGGFLGGLNTYILKLGAKNLPPPFDSDIDRRLAAAPHVVSVRLRLQQTAKLLAAGMEPHLVGAPGAPLWMINIGGGPAIDSLNALILLRRSRPEALERTITVQVLDIDPEGPRFGARALQSLRGEGGALAGVDVTMRHEIYDWNRPGVLEELLKEPAARGAIMVASSEGALFEYGSDEAIVENLRILRPYVKAVAGSVTRTDSMRRRAIAASRFKLVPRGVAGFEPLARRAGFEIERVESTPLSDQVLLRPA